MRDLRQLPQWGQYLSRIGWSIEKADKTQILIRKIPLLPVSIIKIQRPQNPLPFSQIEQIAKKNRALFVLIEPQIEKFSEADFLKHGYKKSRLSLTHTSSIEINLQKPLEKIFSDFGENARRNIKKAQKNDLTTQVIFLKNHHGEDGLKTFFSLLDNLTKLKKFYTPGYGEFLKKVQALKNNSIFLFTYQPGNPQPIASLWVNYFDQKMAYLQTGISATGYQMMANYLLVWEAVKEAKKLNLKIFDFEGIYDPRFPKERKKWQNFTEFKKRFHGTIVQYPPPWIKCYSRVFKLFYLCSRILSL